MPAHDRRAAPRTDGGWPPDVSIIIINFNDGEALQRCLASIRAHGAGLRTETIVVDNGSSDGSAEKVAALFPECRLVALSRNEGIPARNYGLRLATGRHRMFLDSDARLTPGALTRLVDALDSDPSIGLVGPRLLFDDGSPQPSGRRFPPVALPLLRRPPLSALVRSSAAVDRYLMTDVPFDHLREVEYVIGACQLFRKDAQVAAGWIDPKIFYGPDDADWCLRIRRAGFKVALEPRAKVVHEYRRRSAAHPLSRLALRHLRDFTYFQRKWHPMRRWRLEEAARIDGTDGRLSATPSSPDDRADGPGRERGEPDGADGSIR